MIKLCLKFTVPYYQSSRRTTGIYLDCYIRYALDGFISFDTTEICTPDFFVWVNLASLIFLGGFLWTPRCRHLPRMIPQKIVNANLFAIELMCMHVSVTISKQKFLSLMRNHEVVSIKSNLHIIQLRKLFLQTCIMIKSCRFYCIFSSVNAAGENA